MHIIRAYSVLRSAQDVYKVFQCISKYTLLPVLFPQNVGVTWCTKLEI